MATTSPGVQKPHCTAPVSTNACCTGCSSSPAAEPFDRDDLVAVRLRREHEARAHELAVEEHRARTALALLARVLRAGKPEPLAQREEEALPLPDVGLGRSPLTSSSILMRRHRSSARRVSTRSACRRYAAVPRTSSIGLAAAATRSGKPSRSASGAMTSPATGPAEPNDARSRRSRSTASASETTAITIALRGPTFMNVCARAAGRTRTATISSSWRERVPLRRRRGTPPAARGACRARSRARPRRPRRAAAAARPPRARPCRGCRRSSRGCGSAASRPCATPRPALAAAPRARRIASV